MLIPTTDLTRCSSLMSCASSWGPFFPLFEYGRRSMFIHSVNSFRGTKNEWHYFLVTGEALICRLWWKTQCLLDRCSIMTTAAHQGQTFGISNCVWTVAVLEVSLKVGTWPSQSHAVWAETPHLNKYIFHRMTPLWWITFHSSSNQEASHREKLQGKLNWNWQKHGCWSSSHLASVRLLSGTAVFCMQAKASACDGGTTRLELHSAIKGIFKCTLINWAP